MKNSKTASRDQSIATLLDHRQEKREPIGGEVCLSPEGGEPIEVFAALQDYSPHGFRAKHDHPNLSNGRKVRFRGSLGQGIAVVMWNRIIDGHSESGFRIVEK
jgi:hypothetical protein